jgi:hypothetical protein
LTARRYTAAEVALLAEVDRAMGTLSGPATACVLRRQRDVFQDTRFERLGDIAVGHLYNLHNGAPYRAQRVVPTKTRPTRRVDIGVRKAPAPEGRPGFVRIERVHQGDPDGIKGGYYINAVDWPGPRRGPCVAHAVASGGHGAGFSTRRTCCPSSSRCSNSSRSSASACTPTTAASASITA